MKLPIHEITPETRTLVFHEDSTWVQSVVDSFCEISSGSKPKKHTSEFKIHLRRDGDLITAKGNLNADTELLCSRCAKMIDFPITRRFESLYSRNSELLEHPSERVSASALEAEVELFELKTEYLDLGEILNEQLALAIPLQPLCQKDCQGLCANCGADLNKGRCACKKILSQNPFKSLSSLRKHQR